MKGILKKLAVYTVVVSLMLSSAMVWADEVSKEAAEDKKVAQEAEQDPDAIVLIVGEDRIPLRKAYFLFKFQQAILQGMYGSMWNNMTGESGGGSFQDDMKEAIMKLLVRMSLAKQKQKEYGVSISKDEKKNIEEAARLFLESNSKEALDAMMADEQIVIEILTDYTILSKVIAAMTRDTKVEYGEAQTYSYIYASLVGQDSVLEDMSESDEKVIGDFNKIRSRTASGEDFDSVAAEMGYPTAIHTYFMDDARDQLAEWNHIMEGLKSGEVSEVNYIGNGMGVFVGYKQEVDKESLEAAKESLLRSKKADNLKGMIAQLLKEVEITVVDDIWSTVNMEKSITIYRDQES